MRDITEIYTDIYIIQRIYTESEGRKEGSKQEKYEK